MSQAAPGITVRAGVRAPSSRRHIRRLGTPATSRPVPPPSAPGRGSPHPAADPRLLACKQPSPRRGSRSALPAAVSQMNRPDRRPLERPARERQPRLRREPSVASLTPFFGRKTSRSRVRSMPREQRSCAPPRLSESVERCGTRAGHTPAQPGFRGRLAVASAGYEGLRCRVNAQWRISS